MSDSIVGIDLAAKEPERTGFRILFNSDRTPASVEPIGPQRPVRLPYEIAVKWFRLADNVAEKMTAEKGQKSELAPRAK